MCILGPSATGGESVDYPQVLYIPLTGLRIGVFLKGMKYIAITGTGMLLALFANLPVGVA